MNLNPVLVRYSNMEIVIPMLNGAGIVRHGHGKYRKETAMWIYEKKLQYPEKVSTCNPTLARYLVEQYGGADGDLAAALRY